MVMKIQLTASEKTLLVIIAISSWLALVGQLYLIIVNRTTSLPEAIARYFTFFTILTNILVALCGSYIILDSSSRLGTFFSKQSVQAAVAVNILVVGIVYNTVLRSIWNPQGMQRIVDELLHLVVPMLFVFYWCVFARKDQLQWNNIFGWLLYPLLYFVVVLIRGAFSGYYPYPFIDAITLGYKAAFVNSGILTVAFFLLALLFVGIGKMSSKKSI